jgi:hypothetical protein
LKDADVPPAFIDYSLSDEDVAYLKRNLPHVALQDDLTRVLENIFGNGDDIDKDE